MVTSRQRWLAGLTALCACTSPAPPPEPPEPAGSELERCVQDVEYAFTVMQARHPDLFGRNPSARFDDVLREARARGDRKAIFVDLMRLVALAGDSHTRLGSWDEISDVELPVHFESYSDGFWIEFVQHDRADLFGARLIAVEGRPVDEVVGLLAPLVPHENEILLRKGAARLLSLPRALVACGVAPSAERVSLELVDARGAQAVHVLAARPRAEIETWTFIAHPGWKAPLYRTRPYDDWWWCALDDGKTLYLQYNRCVDRPDAPFERVAEECLARLDQGGLERFVVDLRLNGGGDSRVLKPLRTGLASRRRALAELRFFVLIGNGTYSSGEMNARQLAEIGAELVGEPTSQKPAGFGELRSTSLPNTGWAIDCSTKRFEPDGYDGPWLEPDRHVASGFADLIAGRDPALDWARAQRR